jgi:hypothetical protein
LIVEKSFKGDLAMSCMRWLNVALAFCGVAIAPAIALAQELEKEAQDPNQWVLPLGSYSGIRHRSIPATRGS